MRPIALALLLAMTHSMGFAYTVCLDPGHPSEVGRGTKGKRISEMKAAWLIALELKALLTKDHIRVVMTKSKEDEFVKNRRRAEIANEAKADLMLRLHFDAAPERGFATFYPARTGTNSGVTGPQPEVIAASAAIANPFHRAVMGVLKHDLRDRGVRNESMTAVGAKQGALTGSIFSQVPVLLVEMAVLTDPKDEAFIATEKGRQKMAKALKAGVDAALKALDDRAAKRRKTAAPPAKPPTRG